MIHIEVLSSSDPLAIGIYDFGYDSLTIGRSKKNDLIFLDKELPLNYILIKIIEEKNGYALIIKSLTSSPYFFINGKKISGTLKIRANDIIAFGPNKIKILHFEKNHVEEDFSASYEKFTKEASDLKFSLEFIEEVLVDMEKASDV